MAKSNFTGTVSSWIGLMPGFKSGVTSVLFGQKQDFYDYFNRSDVEAIGSDWMRVGNDMRFAINKFKGFIDAGQNK